MDAATRAMLHSLHLQVLGVQASAAALEHTLRVALGDRGPTAQEAVPSKLAEAAEEIRRAVGGPTMEERRESVFMRKAQRAREETTDAAAVASGTPNGDGTVPSAS